MLPVTIEFPIFDWFFLSPSIFQVTFFELTHCSEAPSIKPTPINRPIGTDLASASQMTDSVSVQYFHPVRENKNPSREIFPSDL